MNRCGLVAIIPARGGSKGLKRKNIRSFAGRPLIEHTIEACLNAPCIEHTFVSTEDDEIAAISVKAGACVIPRPLELASDEATTADVVLHGLDWIYKNTGERYENYIMLQPTSPLRDWSDIQEAYELYGEHGDAKSCISLCEAPCHPLKCLVEDDNGIHPLFGRETLNVARQGMPRVYVQTGGIYIGKVEEFLEEKDLYMEPMIPYITTREKGIDIDSEMEFRLAEMIYDKEVG
jgi:CMP-N-acetylneuraminic acid synthetase